MVGERSLLNTQYYKDMLDTSITWTNEFLVKTSKWQFGSLNSEGTDIGTRLNTDLELVYDLTIDDSTGQCSCTIGGDCEKATDSYDLVETYAEVSVFFHFKNVLSYVGTYLGIASFFSVQIQKKLTVKG